MLGVCVISAIEELEVCPSCGNYATLMQDTGWCRSCDPYIPPGICIQCNNEFNEPKRAICGTCRYYNWIKEYADEIEQYMIEGLSFKEARAKVRDDIRPICHCCHQPISGANSDGIFCHKTAACRSAKRRFRTLASRYPREVALQLVTQELLREAI